MSGSSSSRVTKPAADKMTAAEAATPTPAPKFASPTTSFTSINQPVADRAEVEAALKIPLSARDAKPSQKLIKVGIKTLELLRYGGLTAVKKRASSPASDTSFLSSAPSSDADSDTEMADADDSDNEDSLAPMSFDEKIAAATEKATPQKKAGTKRPITPPSSAPATKKARPTTKRDRAAEASAAVQKLAYQSIISMNMPARIDYVPGEPVPEPEEDNLPFGDTENYHNSMIIHYLDECEMTYTKAAEVFSAKFPTEAVTDEAVRKRHIRSLLRLQKKYGERDPATIPIPSDKVRRRGTPRAKGVKNIEPVSDAASTPGASNPSGTATPTPQATTTKKESASTSDDTPKVTRPRDDRSFEKVRVVIWHDADKVDWDAIQAKLYTEYGWSIGMPTIQKYYYTTLERVYGKGGKKEKNREERGKEVSEKRRDGDFEGTVERLVERRMSF
jgi:hypothetical protein